jgi:hypothetical protein
VEASDRHYSYGPADYDRRHIFFATYTYRLPIFRTARGFTGAALARWEISGITRFQSGPYLTPVGSSSIPGTRRAEYLGGPVALPSDQRNANEWFNIAAFSNAPATALGNAGVGIIEGSGWENWDFSLRKVFAIRERLSLRFAAETFNAFNHVNLDAPAVTTSTTSTFGSVSTSQPARNIQFGLHLVF